MQEQIALPEHGWSKFNRVDGGYGVNRSFALDSSISDDIVFLPSRSEINQFILQYEGSDFTKKELGDFITSELMFGSFFDKELRREPSPDSAFINVANVEFLTPLDVIDSWLRAPDVWNENRVSSSKLAKVDGVWTLSNSGTDAVEFSHFAVPNRSGLTFAELLYPSDKRISLAQFSLLTRRPSMSTSIFPILDMHRVPFSVLDTVVHEIYGGIYRDAFRPIRNQWADDSTTFVKNLEILETSNGRLIEPATAEWIFVMAEYAINKDDALRCINQKISHQSFTSYIKRGITPTEAFLYIEHDIDPHLAASLHEKQDVA